MAEKKRNILPPQFPLRVFKWLCRPEYHSDIEGDLLQLYARRANKFGKRRAAILLIKDIVLLLRPGLLRNFQLTDDYNIAAMLKHNFIVSLRNFMRHKTSFLINLVGLTTGLACVIFIGLWVESELAVDKFHEKDKQLFQILNNMHSQNVLTQANTPVPLAEALVQEFPEVEHAVAVNDFFSWNVKEGILSNGDNEVSAAGWHAGPDFFNVFSFELLQGDKDRVLADKNSIVISAELADKLFSDPANAVGKVIQWDHAFFDGSFVVSGVFLPAPESSSIQFDFLISTGVLLDHDRWAKEWTGNYAQTYVVLTEGSDVATFNDKIGPFLKSKNSQLGNFTLFAQLFSDRYLYGEYSNGVATGGRIANVKLFSVVAIFILLIACVNFMNLTTAEASLKMKEIGVKKTIGATQKMLIGRFFSESLLLTTLSMLVAVPLVIVLTPGFNELTGKQLHVTLRPENIVALTLIILLTAIIAGSYPAFYLSRFNPVTVLKGTLKISRGSWFMRKGLVVFQFFLAVVFIVGLLVVNQQLKFTQTKDLGYNRDHILSFQWKGELFNMWTGLSEEKNNRKFESFMTGIRGLPGVVSASNMSGNILDEIYGQSGVTWSGDQSERNYVFQSPIVSYDFIETLQIRLKEGRTFSKEFRDNYQKIILNESAVKMMDLQNPVGKIIDMNGGSEIVGVVEDFHPGSLHKSIAPLIFRCDANGRNVMIRVQTGREHDAIAGITKLYKTFLPDYSFDYTFLDDDYHALYASENKIASLSQYFTFIAILISCLGLFGLSAFTAERRMKEIGIRKILGSTSMDTVGIFAREFTLPVLIAIGAACPVSYFLATHWLTGFSERIVLSGWHFLFAAFAVLTISWVTVALQTIKAVRVNLVQCLKNE